LNLIAFPTEGAFVRICKDVEVKKDVTLSSPTPFKELETVELLRASDDLRLENPLFDVFSSSEVKDEFRSVPTVVVKVLPSREVVWE
jgi:hypothetical protein